MSPGMVASINPSSEGTPSVASISWISASVGPMWRETKESVKLRRSEGFIAAMSSVEIVHCSGRQALGWRPTGRPHHPRGLNAVRVGCADRSVRLSIQGPCGWNDGIRAADGSRQQTSTQIIMFGVDLPSNERGVRQRRTARRGGSDLLHQIRLVKDTQ